jgi:hypothetical protein
MIVLALAPHDPFAISGEEGKLRRLQPQALDVLIRRVPSFIPHLSLLAEPSEYTVKRIIFRRHMFDALWYVWITGILDIAKELHEFGILPVLFKPY